MCIPLGLQRLHQTQEDLLNGLSSTTRQWEAAPSFFVSSYETVRQKMTVTRISVPPLSWAAEYGAFTSVKILLEHGAKINSTDDMYSTPLS
jgi:hypothetical protein